eukprot:355260-Chlamydomonas_euryale.AAC.1
MLTVLTVRAECADRLTVPTVLTIHEAFDGLLELLQLQQQYAGGSGSDAFLNATSAQMLAVPYLRKGRCASVGDAAGRARAGGKALATRQGAQGQARKGRCTSVGDAAGRARAGTQGQVHKRWRRGRAHKGRRARAGAQALATRQGAHGQARKGRRTRAGAQALATRQSLSVLGSRRSRLVASGGASRERRSS